MNFEINLKLDGRNFYFTPMPGWRNCLISAENTEMVRKGDFPAKVCIVCGKPFFWRKKWKNNWKEVKYWSKKCRSNKQAVERS